ncbi:SRPBCC family protein [Actinoplanes sp. NPDC051851]|uniref:SRPBCC family protein n=1 Tax=Actinoplanes sp. NPDC051851 TaxID=3154753 RepID=UPI00343CE366
MSEATITADPDVPIIRIVRDFTATPEQLFRAHTDPAVFARWIGPDSVAAEILEWDARTGGRWRYVHRRGDEAYGFHGCFHEVRPDRIVQTFTFDGQPDGVALGTTTFTDLGGGRTRLHARSLVESFTDRDAWLHGGMATGVNQGYAKLDTLLPTL